MCNLSRKVHCEICEHYSEKGIYIYCSKANKDIGYIDKFLGRKIFDFFEYKPEWCPLSKSLKIEKKEKLSDKYVPYVEPKKESDMLTISLGWTSYHTDRCGRKVMDSVKEAEIVFDDLCIDKEKNKQITRFLNKHCKCSSFYVDEKYFIYCLEKEEKEIDIHITLEEESLPDYINFARVPGFFSLKGGNIKTLKGCPKYVGLGFDCSFNKIKTLKYAPEIVNFKEKEEDLTTYKWDENVSFYCGNNLITSLEGCPTVKRGSILCQMNKIKDFKGLQSEIIGSLQCSNNEISSFDDLPKINGVFYADRNLFQNINEEKIKEVCKCTELSVEGCDKKINGIILTKKFLEEATKKYGNDNFEFIAKTYWGEEPTTLQSKNSKIGIKCKKHDFFFETYPKDFLLGEKMCPLCKMEKYGFNKKNADEFILATHYGNNIFYHKKCGNKELVSKICMFISSNIISNVCNFYINSDYAIDIESKDLSNLNSTNVYYGATIIIENGELPNYIIFGDALVNCISLAHIKTNIFTNEVIAEYPKIISFKGCPKRVFGDFICKNENISSFIDMPIFIGGLFDLSNNLFDDNAWDYAKENIEAEFGDYKIANNKFIKYRKELN